MEKQLIRNRYYLKFLNEKIFNFTYVLSTDSLYLLTDDGLVFVEPLVLKQVLAKQDVRKVENINSLFNPSDYLVSPFNPTDKFLACQYFLTGQQSDIKRDVIARVNAPSGNYFTAVIGSAGTGKTLLIYDIANDLQSDSKRILVIHCGNLNLGQDSLKEQGWNIIPIRVIGSIDVNDYDVIVIVIDEVQRMRSHQFDNFIKNIVTSNCKCLFSFDKLQTLDNSEARNNTAGKIELLPNIHILSLTNKIRTNKEVASFIRGIINNRRNYPVLNCGNVSFEYYVFINDIKSAIQYLKHTGWEVLQLTADMREQDYHARYLDRTNYVSHRVIGQEFDNVVVIIDDYFHYNIIGELTYGVTSYYNAEKMLFQNMTRTRNQLKILILNNPTILERCLTLLNPS